MKKIKFKHWKDENRVLVEVGKLIPSLNNPQSDKYVLQTTDGVFVDIRKSTVVEIEDVN